MDRRVLRPLLDADDRSGFDCGRASMNDWFRRHAWRNQLSGVSRVSVIAELPSGAIVGYVALSAGQVQRDILPRSEQRNRPNDMPVILLGQLAVDLRCQRRGLARTLLFHALRTAVSVSREIGCFGVVTQPLDESVRAFYAQFGFVDLPFDPRRSMIVRMIDLKASGFG
jgi:predicted N-acetyltransferase YhbS